MRTRACCEQGKRHIDRGKPYTLYFDSDQHEIRFCPWCGHDLSQRVFKDLCQALASLLKDCPPQRICFDVDGVLCDDTHLCTEYRWRPPYSWVSQTLKTLKEAGHTIVIQTARYMEKYHGDQAAATAAGKTELIMWLNRHNIPCDEVYLGKASAHIYVDDRACQVVSNGGNTDWIRFITRLKGSSGAGS